MTVNERVKEIRKSNDLTMDKFGERIGVTKAAISKIEKGERGVTDQMIKLMVKEFGVNENWLRTGDGEMFPESDKTVIIIKRINQTITENPNSFKSRFISSLVQMTDEQWNFFEDILFNLLRSENYE